MRLLQAGLRAVRHVGTGQPLSRVLEPLATGLMAYLGADRCLCAILNGEGQITAVEGMFIEGERLTAPGEALSHFLLRQVTRGGKTVYVADARRDRRWRSQEDQRCRRQVRSLVGLPVYRGDELVAVLTFSHSSAPLAPRAEDDLVFLIAQLLGLAIVEDIEEEPVAGPEVPAPHPPREIFSWQGFQTQSEAVVTVLQTAERVARTDVPVLIVGEDGTGKDLLARAIHAASARAGPFVVASAGAIPESLIEGELFGYVKGAFTGAETPRRGLIGQAHGGTLFLDDLTVMSPAMQGALLRVLSEGVVRPLGSDEARAVDVRLIAASTVSPAELRRQRILRDDLLYRLHGVALALPPLRERPEDIGLLFAHFLAEAGPGSVPKVSAEAERFLLLHPWPGNVRELKNEAERLRALVEGEIQCEDLSFVVPGRELEGVGASTLHPLPEAVKQTEREAIERALALAEGNKSEAARLLGITRRSLYRRLKRYGM